MLDVRRTRGGSFAMDQQNGGRAALDERARAEYVAERVAEAIVGDQVKQARELTRTLVQRATELLRRLEDAESVKASVDRLVGELDDVTSQMSDLPGGEPQAAVPAEE